MSNTFHTTQLTSNRVLVRGTDFTGAPQQVVLDGSELAWYAKRDAARKAEQSFDSTVEEFFAPLTDAAEELARSLNEDISGYDEEFFIVEQEATAGAEAKPEIRTRLTGESIILRILASGDHSRLVWVNGEIELLAKGSVEPVLVSEDIADQSHGTFEVEVGKAPESDGTAPAV